MMDMIDLFDVGITHDSNVIKARHHRAHHLECRGQRTQGLHIGLRTHQLVMVKHNLTDNVFDGQDGARKALLSPCTASALLAFNGICVDIVAAVTISGGNKIGRNALRNEVIGNRRTRVDWPCAAV